MPFNNSVAYVKKKLKKKKRKREREREMFLGFKKKTFCLGVLKKNVKPTTYWGKSCCVENTDNDDNNNNNIYMFDAYSVI